MVVPRSLGVLVDRSRGTPTFGDAPSRMSCVRTTLPCENSKPSRERNAASLPHAVHIQPRARCCELKIRNELGETVAGVELRGEEAGPGIEVSMRGSVDRVYLPTGNPVEHVWTAQVLSNNVRVLEVDVFIVGI